MGCIGLLATATHAQNGATATQPRWFTRSPLPRDTSYPGMGLVPTSEERFARSPRFRITRLARGERPPRVLLTDYLPPINNQGSQGSCVAWSTAYYCYSYSVARQRRLTREQLSTAKFQFSPAFLYHQLNGGQDHGSSIGEAFNLLQRAGCATFAEMPYDVQDFTSAPSEAAREHASLYRARRIGCLFRGYGANDVDVEKCKTFLAEAQIPFVMAIPVFSDFPTGPVSPDTVYNVSVTPDRSNLRGLHAITIIGYDEDRHAFRMVNSWGPNWGEGGFLWLSEEFVRRFGGDGWTEAPGGIIARDVVRGSAPGRLTPHIALTEPAASGTR